MDTDQIKKFLPLATAGVLGVGAAGMGWVLVQRPAPVRHAANGEVIEQQPAFDMAPMVIASKAISAGDPIGAEALEIVSIPADVRPDTAFASVAELLSVDGFENAGAATPRIAAGYIAVGQPVMGEHLAPLGAEAGLAAMFGEGQRAITIHVDTYTGLRGFLQPNARVDIVSTLHGQGQPSVRTIVQDIRVLAVDGTLAGRAKVDATDAEKLNEEGPKNSVTLLVTPEQAARIELAYANGTPRLVLRGAGDRALSRFEGLTLAELSGQQPKWGEPLAGDPWSAMTGGAPEPLATEGHIASIGVESIEAPGPVGGAGDAEPTTRPAELPALPKAPRPHVVEIIRGGVSDRAVVPDRSATPTTPTPPTTAPAADADASPSGS